MGGIPNRSESKGLDFNFSELIGESSLPESSINRLKRRAVMNMNFAREFGGIEPSYLMNDHTWARGDSGVKEIDTVKHPLQHALLMFKRNKYNPSSSAHSSSVKSEGKRLMTLPVIQEWLAGSEFGRNALRGKNK
jgi:hypothetical protein